MCFTESVPPQRGDASRSSRTSGAGCDGRWVAAWFCRADERSLAHGEVAWSWPPDAEVKPAGDAATQPAGDGGKEARSPGRARISRQTSRREGRACSARPVVPAACIFSQAGHGRGQRPAFPAPSATKRAVRWMNSSGGMRREIARLCRSEKVCRCELSEGLMASRALEPLENLASRLKRGEGGNVREFDSGYLRQRRWAPLPLAGRDWGWGFLAQAGICGDCA